MKIFFYKRLWSSVIVLTVGCFGSKLGPFWTSWSEWTGSGAQSPQIELSSMNGSLIH